MPEVTVSEPVKPTEVAAGKYIIRFEPGVHPFPLTDVLFKLPGAKVIRQRFEAGDLTAHAWNPEVAQRMKQYSPQVLGLDSVPGGLWSKALNWPWLPGSPKEMSGRESMYVVGGDMLHQDFLYNEEGNKIGWGRVAEYTAKTLVVEGIGGHILLPTGLILLASRISGKSPDNTVENPARRAFLKKTGIGLGALSVATFLGKLAPAAESYATTSENLAQKVNQIIRPMTKSTWLDGRTALVIAKTSDAMNELGLPKDAQGSVVMGFPHAYEAGSLLTDKKIRAEAIRKYAQEYCDDIYPAIGDETWDYVKEGLQDKSSEKEKRALLMDYVLLDFLSTKIYEVKEPDSYHTDTPDATAQNLIREVNWFMSPEVMEAIAPLANTERLNRLIADYNGQYQRKKEYNERY